MLLLQEELRVERDLQFLRVLNNTLVSENRSYLKKNRLLTKNDFKNLRSGSRFLVCGVLLFYFKCNSSNDSRLGIAVNKKFGKANKRNRVKRKIREFFRASNLKNQGFDILVTINTKKIKKETLSFEDFDRLIIPSLDRAEFKIL